MPDDARAATEAFKALGDPVRWRIVREIARQGELAAAVLEQTLPLAKPTISYHVKILDNAGLLEVCKRGRRHFYRLRLDTIAELVDALSAVASGPPVVDETGGAARRRPGRRTDLPVASGDDQNPITMLTW